MSTTAQLDHDLYRVLLYRRDASELLLQSTADGLELPVVSVPRFTRVAEKLTAGIKDRWNLDTCCLFPVLEGISSSVSIPFHVVELSRREAETPAAMRWLAATSLSAADFRDHDDFVAVQASLVRLEGFRRGELSGAFGKPGWLRTVTEWVAQRAATARLSLTGKFRQLNASATFSLLRFETDGPALWFKAVGEPNVHEFSITLALARLFPHFVPRVIGHRADWNAWLSVEAAGTHLSDTAPLSNWQQAAARLADLQIASCGYGLHLIDAGSKDIRICSLVPHVEPFFERMAEVMELQTKFTPHPLARAEIRSLSEEVRSCLDELRAIDIPNTLGHLDFNPGNILVSPEQCVFLDWAEGSVGHPFFTFQYLLEHWRRFHKSEIDSEKALVSSYTVPWRAFASPDEIAKNLALAPLLAVFACATALGWNDPDACKRPVIAGYLRSLVRRMRRESDALQERRVTCVP
jgi:Phosphotransferase enzyme family